MEAQSKQFNEGHWSPGFRIYFCPGQPALSKTWKNVKCVFDILPSSPATSLNHLHLFTQGKTTLDTDFSGIWEASMALAEINVWFYPTSDLSTDTYYSETGKFFCGNLRDQCLLAGATRGTGRLPSYPQRQLPGEGRGRASLLLRKGRNMCNPWKGRTQVASP